MVGEGKEVATAISEGVIGNCTLVIFKMLVNKTKPMLAVQCDIFGNYKSSFTMAQELFLHGVDASTGGD